MKQCVICDEIGNESLHGPSDYLQLEMHQDGVVCVEVGGGGGGGSEGFSVKPDFSATPYQQYHSKAVILVLFLLFVAFVALWLLHCILIFFFLHVL